MATAGRVELHTLESGVVRERAWSTGDSGGSTHRRIEVGTLPSGAWYAWHTGKPGGAYITHTERATYNLIDKWLNDGREWVPTPARFDASGQPCDQLTWYRSGGTWLLGKRPTG